MVCSAASTITTGVSAQYTETEALDKEDLAKHLVDAHVNVRSKPLLAVRYESQVYIAIWSEQLSREERELKREDGGAARTCRATRDLPLVPPTP
jgi:hypothetical protein